MRDEPVDFSRTPDDWTRTPGRFFPEPSSRSPAAPPPFHVLSEPAAGPAPYLLVPSVVTRWKISKDNLDKLKSDFSPSASDSGKSKTTPLPEEWLIRILLGKWISSGDALAALLCGTVTRARDVAGIERVGGRSTEDSGVEVLAMAADGRSRAPEGNMMGRYFGNFNNLPSVTFSRTDLLSTTHACRSTVALAIREGISEQLSPQAIANRIQFYETVSPKLIAFNADIILTNWCRFDLEGPEYGIYQRMLIHCAAVICLTLFIDIGWGKPFYTTSGAGDTFPPGYSIMTQNHDSGEVSVLLTIEKEAADSLKRDAVLTKYATQVSSSE